MLVNAEVFGVTGTAGASPDCRSVTEGGSIPDAYGTWVLVPGNDDYGTNDFCVMKYEAKCSRSNATSSECTTNISTESPTSTAANYPWVFISQQDAITECASLGKGYHLMTNDEWMTIASNIAARGSNWSGDSVGVGQLSRGHSDNSPTIACPADTVDTNAFLEDDAGTSCTTYATGTEDEEDRYRRTDTLSNDAVIWDIAGNVREWTSYFNVSDKPYPQAGSPDANWYNYDYPVVSSSSLQLDDLVPQAAISGSWDHTAQSIGRFYPDINTTGGAGVRGGIFSNTSTSGIFTMLLNYSPSDTSGAVGFRCVVSAP